MDTHLDPRAAVVVGYDGSPGSELALDWACAHARLAHRPLEIFHATGASLRVAEPAASAPATSEAGRRTASRRLVRLEEAAGRIRDPSGGLEVRTVLHHGGARSALLRASRDASVVVMGATSQGAVESMVLGSVAQGVAKEARCPVVIVRRSHASGVRSVLVGTDLGEHSAPAIAFAFRVAALRSCPLTVLHCFWDIARAVGDVPPEDGGYDAERSTLAAAVRPHAELHPEVEVTLLLSRGFADRRLIQATHDHDLVVIGHHKLPLLDAVVWGNVTPLVVREAVGDVAVVPAASHPVAPTQGDQGARR